MQLTEERSKVACCGSINYWYILSEPLSFDRFSSLEKINSIFKPNPSYKAYGLVYIDNKICTITGSIGSNRLRIVYKIPNEKPLVLALLTAL